MNQTLRDADSKRGENKRADPCLWMLHVDYSRDLGTPLRSHFVLRRGAEVESWRGRQRHQELLHGSCEGDSKQQKQEFRGKSG